MGPTDGGEVEPRSLGMQVRGRTPTVDGGVEADMLGSRGCGCDRARNAASRQTLSRAVTDVGHHHTRRPPSFDHMTSGGVGPGGLLGWFPRVLRRTPLLRGPRVALVRLFEPGVSSCLSLEEEEGLEGRQVGISGGGGAFACPRPGTHSRSQPSQDNSVPSGSHREERCLREFLAARTPHASINEEKRSQGRQRDPGRIGLGADPSDKLAEGSTSLGPVARGTGVGGVRRN